MTFVRCALGAITLLIFAKARKVGLPKGKSTFLTKIANHSFNLGYNVLQIFFEDNPKIIQRKHITLWTKVHPDELSTKKDEVMDKVREVQSKMENRLILKKLPSDTLTMLQIKNQLRKMIADGVKLDMVVLDYIDCIVPDKNLGDEWKSEGSVMRGFEAMCHELNLVGWTATQGNRSSISSEVVTTDQMGGSIKKAQVGHVIISVAKTLQQKEMKLATIAGPCDGGALGEPDDSPSLFFGDDIADITTLPLRKTSPAASASRSPNCAMRP